MDIKLIDLKNKLEKDFGWENLMADNDNKWFVDNLLNDAILAINDMQCCVNDDCKEAKALEENNEQRKTNFNNEMIQLTDEQRKNLRENPKDNKKEMSRHLWVRK